MAILKAFVIVTTIEGFHCSDWYCGFVGLIKLSHSFATVVKQ